MKDLKEQARLIFLRALERIDVGATIDRKLRLSRSTLIVGDQQVNLNQYDEIILLGIGKASIKMGYAIERMLGDRVKSGVLVTDRRSRAKVKSEVIVGGHPIPTQGSLDGARRLIELARSATDRTLVVFLISGGGSALVELPTFPDVTLEDLREMNRILVTCGASIREINTIRKHLSAVKGGRLGSMLNGAGVIALFVSDVNAGDLRSIASNPALSEDLRSQNFFDVLEKYALMDRLPESIAKAIEVGLVTGANGIGGSQQPVEALLLSDNSTALQAAGEAARELGFRTIVYEDLAEGKYQNISAELFKRLFDEQGRSPNEPICMISGGEVSCPVFGDGLGGRNQEFVLYSAASLARSGINQPTAVLSCGTDGIDGNSLAAGAVADERTVAKALEQGIIAADYLERNDSHSFFVRTGGVVFTGPTGNNVRDVRLLLSSPN
jgi:glycerate 2-kinase